MFYRAKVESAFYAYLTIIYNIKESFYTFYFVFYIKYIYILCFIHKEREGDRKGALYSFLTIIYFVFYILKIYKNIWCFIEQR